MRKVIWTSLCAILCAMPALAAPADAAGVDFAGVEAVLGRPPMRSGDVYRYGFPRSDLAVTVDGVRIEPALALGGWVAFTSVAEPAQGVVMGDLVLTEAEVEPVMKSLLAGGVAVTALHNHLLRATPPTLYMHIAGHGDAVELAKTIRSALEHTKTPLEAGRAASRPSPSPTQPLDIARIEDAIGSKGRLNGGVYQFSAPRSGSVSHEGMTIPAAMGTANAMNFQPTGRGRAVIAGDLVAQAGEVDSMIETLLAHGVEVTAIHSHMLAEEPRLFFVHFWANDDAVKLAGALRSALDRVGVKRKSSEAGSH